MASGSSSNLWVWLAGGGCGWKLWTCLVGVVLRRYIDFLILLIPIYSSCICSFLQQHPNLKKIFFVLVPLLFGNLCLKKFLAV